MSMGQSASEYVFLKWRKNSQKHHMCGRLRVKSGIVDLDFDVSVDKLCCHTTFSNVVIHCRCTTGETKEQGIPRIT